MKTLLVAAAQMRFGASVPENVENIRCLLGSVIKADAVLFPECALTGYNIDFSKLRPAEIEMGLTAVAQAAREFNCNLLAGSPTFERRRWFNSLIVFDRRG